MITPSRRVDVVRGELRQHVFDPVCEQISDLVEGQLKSSQETADRGAVEHGEEPQPLRFKVSI
jgi:hypothetical protein